jgi:hypothetical protein
VDLNFLLMLTFLIVVSVKVVSYFYYENQKYELKYRREKHAPKP